MSALDTLASERSASERVVERVPDLRGRGSARSEASTLQTAERDTGPLAGAGGGTDDGVELGRFFEHSTAVLSGFGRRRWCPRRRCSNDLSSTIRPFRTLVKTRRVTIVDWSRHRAVLFDLDGVITPTAAVHEHAWAELFAPWDFTAEDYLTYVDGKPRYDGVRSFLDARDVSLPEGSPDDPPGDDTICAMGNRKNEVFNAILERDGVTPYPGTMRVLDHLDGLGLAQAIVSSSKNARPVLRAAGLGDRFDHVVDGLTAVEEGLAGKPDPAMFQRGAALLGVDPADTVVVEDASSGVAAGAAGGFGFVLGVDRGGNREALLAAGAGEVVDDLAETLTEVDR